MMTALLLGFLNACLMTGGIYFQKLNGVRGGSPVASGWLVLALVCYAPTFWVGNVAMGSGRIAPFLAASALFYVFSTAVARLVFDEPLPWRMALGLAFIMLGVGLVVTGGGVDGAIAAPGAAPAIAPAEGPLSRP